MAKVQPLVCSFVRHFVKPGLLLIIPLGALLTMGKLSLLPGELLFSNPIPVHAASVIAVGIYIKPGAAVIKAYGSLLCRQWHLLDIGIRQLKED